MVKLENVRLVESKPDERRWKLEPNGKFSCNSFHSFLISGGSDPIFPPAKFIWKVKVPTKVKILGWLVVLGKTNTCDVLQRRRPGSCFSPHWCILCKAQGESADHVFVHCEVANFLWKKLFWEARVDWTTPLQRNDLLRENPIAFGKDHNKVPWFAEFSFGLIKGCGFGGFRQSEDCRLCLCYSFNSGQLIAIPSRVAIPLTFPLSWDFGFRRNLNDQETEECASLLAKLENVRLQESKPDERRWKLEPTGNFSCKSFHIFLTSGASDPIFDPAKFIWNVKAPTKVKILGWLVVLGKTNTCDVLQKKRPGSCFSPHWCILCRNHGESADHVFVHCDVTISLWKKLFREARVDWTNPLQRSELLREKPLAFGKGKKAKTLWGCGVLAVCWVVWLERNRRIFENYGGSEREDMWERVKFWASLWVSISKEFKDYSLSSIILNWQAAVV
ncbi:uncharacterized protein LOC112192237 isoform X2 [Rosa chinensis]|uniref:uncharacterized protein LOC112192237 isoform X2 n=1 Tax=Rosa chinensis TaxID=74649 RepID=UPI001AD8ABAA|nr:uncharacterized protein LOC112192237 isoform X2 [Rosa chinensis]